jgi:alkylhydroperoxidase/carboxymuconolactone decarboxylase family protein YurZ
VATIAPSSNGRLIDLAPELLESYQSFVTAVFDGGTLTPAARAAAALAAAVALNRPEVVRSFLAAAKQVGLTNEDIGHVAAIVDVVRIETHQGAAAAVTATAHNHQPKASKSCC